MSLRGIFRAHDLLPFYIQRLASAKISKFTVSPEEPAAPDSPNPAHPLPTAAPPEQAGRQRHPSRSRKFPLFTAGLTTPSATAAAASPAAPLSSAPSRAPPPAPRPAEQRPRPPPARPPSSPPSPAARPRAPLSGRLPPRRSPAALRPPPPSPPPAAPPPPGRRPSVSR